MKTHTKILQAARTIFAQEGASGLSMRRVAKETGIAQSVIYHHFANKKALMRAIYDRTNYTLGQKRSQLPETETASEMLKQRIGFQIDFSEEIVAVLKFYLMERKMFSKNEFGFVPEKTSLHIEEVLIRGVEEGEFIEMDIKAEAKVITHAINGFLLEYYPHKPRGEEKQKLIDSIARFVLRSIKA